MPTKKKTIKRICSHCNAKGGRLIPRSAVNLVHEEYKDCQRVLQFRIDNGIHESVELRIMANGEIESPVCAGVEV